MSLRWDGTEVRFMSSSWLIILSTSSVPEWWFQSSVHTTLARLFEMELEPNLLDWNVNGLKRELELEDMKRTIASVVCKNQILAR